MPPCYILRRLSYNRLTLILSTMNFLRSWNGGNGIDDSPDCQRSILMSHWWRSFMLTCTVPRTAPQSSAKSEGRLPGVADHHSREGAPDHFFPISTHLPWPSDHYGEALHARWPVYTECWRDSMEDFVEGLDHSHSDMDCLVLLQLGSHLPHLISEHGPHPTNLWACYEDAHGPGPHDLLLNHSYCPVQLF